MVFPIPVSGFSFLLYFSTDYNIASLLPSSSSVAFLEKLSCLHSNRTGRGRGLLKQNLAFKRILKTYTHKFSWFWIEWATSNWQNNKFMYRLSNCNVVLSFTWADTTKANILLQVFSLVAGEIILLLLHIKHPFYRSCCYAKQQPTIFNCHIILKHWHEVVKKPKLLSIHPILLLF